jgi:hypothetical protein
MDTNNGYVYAAIEATADDHQLTNAWENEQTIDEVRKRTERQAFEQLIQQFKSEWPTILATYNRQSAPPSAAAPPPPGIPYR